MQNEVSSVLQSSQNVDCVHCGENCGKSSIVWQQKDFCCEGCKTVYQLLNENELSNYYDLYEAPGIKVETPDYGKKYAYLDNETIIKKLLHFNEGEYSKVRLYIPDIHCSSCIWLLENLFQLNKAITQSSVNFIKKEVEITFNNAQISLRSVAELLVSIHYIPMISLESVTGERNKTENKSLVIKIGVAGFAFGNTMLLSLPDYIPGGQLLELDFKHFFGYLNLLFAIPVLLYSASDYLLSAYKNIRRKIVNIDLPISIGVLTIFFESAYQILSSTGTGYMDSLAGLVFFLLIGKWYQSKTYQALSFERDYKSYFPVAVTKIVDEGEEIIPLVDIQVGDKIVVHNQELIPADGILIKGEANINYSFVTGESSPVYKQSGDELYAGGKQLGSTIVVEVVKKVMQSKLTQLWNQDTHQQEQAKDLTMVIDRISKTFTITILLVATLAAIYWMFTEPSVSVIAFTSVLIVACPCALVLSVPFTYGNIMQLFGRVGFYLKKSEVVEGLSGVDTLVFDKTGTITYIDTLSVKYQGETLTHEQVSYVKSLARESKHPLSKAVFDSIEAPINESIEGYEEVASAGIKANFGNSFLKMGSAAFVGLKEVKSDFKTSMVYLSINDKLMGHYSVENKYREGIGDLASCLTKDFDLHIISGDNNAEEIRLKQIFGDQVSMRFNQSPMDKFNYIKFLRENGKNVLMVGDGLNDAGALNESNVGISIADDVFNFSPASDAILEAKGFHLLPGLIDYSKRGMKVVYASFVISFLYNLIGLSFAVSGNLSPIVAAILMPVSSVTVVSFVTLSTRFMMRRLK